MAGLNRGAFVAAAGVAVLVLASGLLQNHFAYRDAQQALVQIEHEQALRAASAIAVYLGQMERQLTWAIDPDPGTAGAMGLQQRQSVLLRLLRQEQAVTSVRYLDARGIEAAVMSGPLSPPPPADLSADPRFLVPKAGRPYRSEIYYRNLTEPYLTIAVADSGPDAGVTVAEVSLKFLWDVVSRMGRGSEGNAYVVDEAGRLIAHSDWRQVLHLVVRSDQSQALERRDYSQLPQVQAALAGVAVPMEHQTLPLPAYDLTGREVLAAYARVDPPGWVVMVEQPLGEARGGLYAGVLRTALLAALWLVLCLLTSVGAARFGGRALRRKARADSGDTLSSSR
jgi:hypothetical protein